MIVDNNNDDNCENQQKLNDAAKDDDSLVLVKSNFKMKIVWRNVIIMSIIHVFAIYGFIWTKAKLMTFFWTWLMVLLSAFGVLAGAHRLWSHRSYKARWPLRLLLMIGQTIALQNDIYEWCRDHRVHHKYSDTDADPHNSRRGFFFSHMGWLLCRKHPDVIAKGSTIDMSDVWADPIVRFQRRFYIPLVLLLWGIFPVWIPIYFWQEDLLVSLSINMLRYVMSLHHAWLVNSAAHYYGYRYYDRQIRPRENIFVTYLTYGEGYHNYHHVFPWDYSASEYGWNQCFNVTTALIDFCATIGLAYDRRIVTKSIIQDRIDRTGEKIIDGYDENNNNNNGEQKRKPESVIIDTIIGFLLVSWPFILKICFFNV